MTDKEIEQLSEIALKEEEGKDLNLWDVPDNKEMRDYWKEVWILGFKKGIKFEN